MSNITISLDAMGGDAGATVVVPAALESLKKHPNLNIVLVGQKQVLLDELQKCHAVQSERLRIHHAAEVVNMDEPPAQALRFKKDSSMRIAINLVKEGVAHGCVSAGNTGALMATAKFVLKTLPGIDRPAISALLPTIIENKNVRVLDLGANVDSTAEQLFQFAVMGSMLASAVRNIANPVVALLNVGEEAIKGNEQVKQTAKLLEKCEEINYIGFVEGDDIYKGVADVIICDGFVGNVALKTSEGLVKLLSLYIKQEFNRNFLCKILKIAASHVLTRLKSRLDPARYNGASFLGLHGTVVKSHGNANVEAYTYAIEEAILEVQKNVPERIGKEVELLLLERASERQK